MLGTYRIEEQSVETRHASLLSHSWSRKNDNPYLL